MTGMAIAAAWRAIDEAQKALTNLNSLEARITQRTLRTLAYVEALDLRERRARGRIRVADPLCRAFSSASPAETCAILSDLANHPESMAEFKSLAVPAAIKEYMVFLANSDETSRNVKADLFKLAS